MHISNSKQNTRSQQTAMEYVLVLHICIYNLLKYNHAMLLVTVAAIEVKYICKRNSCIRIFTTSGSSTLYVKFKHDPANLQASWLATGKLWKRSDSLTRVDERHTWTSKWWLKILYWLKFFCGSITTLNSNIQKKLTKGQGKMRIAASNRWGTGIWKAI